MKEYQVMFPFAGVLNFNVEANSKEEAKAKCYELMEQCVESGKDPMEEFSAEWDMYEKIVEGNICHVSPSRVDIEEM